VVPATILGPAARTGRDTLLVPLATVLAMVRALVDRPAILVASTVLLVCVPVGNQDVAAAVHVTPADLGSAGLVAAVALRALGGYRLPRSPMWTVLGATLVGFGLAALTSQDPGTSRSGLVRYVQLFVLVPLAVVVAVRTRRDLQLICAAVLAAALVQGAVGTVQYLTGTGASYDGQNVRAVGTFGALDVMGMATVVGYGVVIALGLALTLPGPARRALLAIAALLGAPLLLSQSRGALIATVAAVAAMLLVTRPRLVAPAGVLGAAAAVVLIAVLGSGGSGTTGVGARITTIGAAASAPDRSVSDRYALWRTAAGIWRDHPVTGVGLKEFPAFRDSYAPLSLSSGSEAAGASLAFQREPLLSPHNMYLLVLSEQGVVGALGLGGLLLGMLLLTVRRSRQWFGGHAGDAARPDGRFVGPAAVGVLAWTVLSFLYSDVGGPSTVETSVLLGVALWWAVQPRPGARPSGLRPAGREAPALVRPQWTDEEW
jgi:O-antigen ligase